MRVLAVVLALSALSASALATPVRYRGQPPIFCPEPPIYVEGHRPTPVAIIIRRDDAVRSELAAAIDQRLRDSATPSLSTRIP